MNITRASPNRSYFYTEFIFKLYNIKYKILTIAPLTSADMSEYSKKSIFLYSCCFHLPFLYTFITLPTLFA